MKQIILLLLLSAEIYAQGNQQFFIDAEKGYVYSMYHYKNENLNIHNEEGQTPLIVAVQHKHADVIRAFSEGNVDISLRDYSGKTAYDHVEHGKKSNLYGTLKYLEVKQIIKGKDKVVSYSFEKGLLDFVIPETKCDNYLFPENTKCHETKKDIKRYVDIGYFLNLKDENPELFLKVFPNYTDDSSQEVLEKEANKSLFRAIREKDNRVFDAMIEYVDIEIKNKSNYSIFWKAIYSKNYHVVSYMLQRGVDIYAYDPTDLRTPLLWAIQTNDVQLLELLIAHGVDLDSKDKFGNPILFKAMYHCKSFETIAIMLDNGANPYLKNNRGETIFDAETFIL